MHPAVPHPHRRGVAAATLLLAAIACVDAPTTAPTGAAARGAVVIASPTGTNKPDLVVQSVSHSPASPTDVDAVTFTATVANVGQNKAPHAFAVRFDFGNGASEIVLTPSLAGGASVQVSSTPRTIAAGSYTATVTADYGDLINEGNETNNSATDAYTVTNHNIITF